MISENRKKYRLAQLISAVTGYLGALLAMFGGVTGWNVTAAIGAAIFALGFCSVLGVGVLVWFRDVK
ncbi:hypothetical protein [Lignipirellula cremea]|uniref:Uncharacterized protein n=1 Tax=Lignipirellula cremea TaxID=2528010 RepID=A0A518DZF7_9BACT|nr:hypothetical protein [Lignipirellula cremea]QDU97191.1 hypothetical protein Pla8534_50360 [Lignipirellula cremea]